MQAERLEADRKKLELGRVSLSIKPLFMQPYLISSFDIGIIIIISMSVIENLTQEKKRLDEERRKRKEAEAAAAEARKKAEAAKHVQNENVSKDFLRVVHRHDS